MTDHMIWKTGADVGLGTCTKSISSLDFKESIYFYASRQQNVGAENVLDKIDFK